MTKAEAGQQPLDRTALLAPPYSLDLPLRHVTVAESLAAAGYRTAFFGKWHVARHHERYLGWSPTHGPRQQGFEVAEEDFGSHPYAQQGMKDSPTEPLADGVFPVDSLTDRAVGFVQSQAKADEPFFLMVSHFYVHTPVKPRVDWLSREIREQFPDLPDARVRYAVFVRLLDHYVGELLGAIDAAGLQENTLVVFTSDNGGDPRFADHGPLRGHKWSLYEGGVRVPAIVRWPGHTPAGSVQPAATIGTDWLPTLLEIGQAEQPLDEPLDGVSIAALLRDPAARLPDDRSMLWHFPYYHPESGSSVERVRRQAGIGPLQVEQAGVDDGQVPFLEPHAALRTGTEKLLYFFESDRIERYTLAADGSIDETAGQSFDQAAARRRIFDALAEHNARLPTTRPLAE